MDVGADVVVFEIETTIAVEIAVLAIAGVTFFCAPDLFTGFDIATEGGGPCGGEDGGKDAVGGTGFGMEESVGIENEPADFGFLEVVFYSWVVGAFGQPDTAGIAPETLVVVVACDLDLGADGLRKFAHEGKKSVSGSAGNDFENASVLEFAEGVDEVAVVVVAKEGTAVVEALVVELGEGVESGIVTGAVQFFGGEFQLFFEAVDVAILEEGIAEHGAEGWGHRHSESKINSIPNEAFHHIEEGQIGFGDGFVEPIFFEEFWVLGMPDKRQVSVQNGGDESEGHGG